MQDEKQQDKSVKAFLEYANSIIDTGRVPFLVLDKNLRVISSNQSFYTTFKVTRKDTIGCLLSDLGNKQWDIPKLLVLLTEILPEKTIVKDYEVQHKFESIGERTMMVDACKLRVTKKIAGMIAAIARQRNEEDEEDEEELILVSIEDITDRLRLQEELKNSEERFRRAFETSRDGLLLVHKTGGNVLNSNATVQKALGYSQEEFLRKKLWEIGVTNDVMDFQEMMSRLTIDGVIYFEDTQVKTQQGLSINVDIFLVDKAKVLQCNIRDVSERKKAEEVLLLAKENAEAANKAKSEFLNNIAHDFRTPTHAIMGFSAFLKKEQLTQKQRQFVDIINKSGKNLQKLVVELLDVSKLESGRLTLRIVEFDLKESVISAFNLVHVLLLDKDIKMSYSIEDGFPRLKGDLVRLEHIFTNLMENAVKYTDQGEITVKAERVLEGCSKEKCRLKFSVKDTGLGIPKDSIGQIFDVYTRFHEFAGNRDRGGTGLGLYIVKTMVDMMGGTINVVSEVGVGSEFIVTLDFDIVR